MKADKRVLFRELTKELETSLCCLCKYGESNDVYSLCDDEGYYTCNHPIENLSAMNKYEDDVYPGDDCIGFKNEMKLPELLELVSLVLSNGYSRWLYEKHPDRYEFLAERKEGEELKYYKATIKL